jgi:hypothetical protein
MPYDINKTLMKRILNFLMFRAIIDDFVLAAFNPRFRMPGRISFYELQTGPDLSVAWLLICII